jgi:hypothetical protein
MTRDVGMDSFPGHHTLIFIQFNLCFLNTTTAFAVNGHPVSTANHLVLTYTSARIAYDICNAEVFVIINATTRLLPFFSSCGNSSILVVTWSRSYRKVYKLCPCSKARVLSAGINNQEVN